MSISPIHTVSLSGAQTFALDWFRRNGANPRWVWVRASISSRTVASLTQRGLLNYDRETRVYACTQAGKDYRP